MNYKIKGFTLIELLVSVLILVVLTGSILVVINPAKIRGRARDTQRISDLKQLQTALEAYYRTNRAYPSSAASVFGNFSESGWLAVSGSDALSVLLYNGSYSNRTFLDPTPTGSNQSPCLNPTEYRYSYNAPAVSSGSTFARDYLLTAIMENSESNDTSVVDGNSCDKLKNWSSVCSTYQTQDVCYGVENN